MRKRNKFLRMFTAEEDAGGAGAPETPPQGAPADPPVTPANLAGPEAGQSTYPANTPVAEMTPQQQTAYYKHQLYLERAASKKAKDAAELKATQAAMTEQERAVAAARVEERATVTKELRDELIKAKFDAIGVGLNAAQLTSLKANINSAAFLDENGKPDDAKIADFLAPFQGSATLSNRDLRPQGSTFHGSSIAAEMKRMATS